MKRGNNLTRNFKGSKAHVQKFNSVYFKLKEYNSLISKVEFK